MRKSLCVAALLLVVAGCSTNTEAPRITAADAWVRTTDGAQRPDMTALFVNLTNPGDRDVRIVGADCGDVAGMVQIHEMIKQDGTMIMREAADGVVVPRESHLHMAPGGPHVMLMKLNRELPAGGEEVSCTLRFDNDQEIRVSAPVKHFTEEQDTYHTHAPGEN